MKWKTHRTITKFACKKLNWPEEYIEPLLEACVEPDRNREKELTQNEYGETYHARVSHHSKNPDEIDDSRVMKHIWDARVSFLRGNNLHFIKSLGYALHYIQDGAVSKYRKILFFERESYKTHNKREEDLRFIPFPSKHKIIEKCARTIIKTPQKLEASIQKLSPKKDPKDIMLFASAYTLLTLNAVGNRNAFPDTYKKSYLYYGQRHGKFLLYSLLISLFISLFLIYFFSPLYIVLPLIIVCIIHKLDSKYHEFAKIAKWYGKEISILNFLF